ncbi:MAG: hypothetical protein COV67_15660 [Nitrospinae bacterium CG11_big_fil_rev_8_21_14_0_20_56_8]|nr:MAG: hypothetical protein COV67_15660 [Nitrospinae bacterium CG11_big_fil_rev_8_21_14_0_20_56_8]
MLKTTLIGHACLFIQSRETNFLTDPVFFDPHWESINVQCPERELKLESVPPVHILYLSHRHQDHFDVRTLAYLKRHPGILLPETVVLAPQDEILLEVLKELEFDNVQVVNDFEPVRIRDLTLTPTPSFNQDEWPEHGLLIHDGEVTVWNQVDTIVNPQVIQYIHKLYPTVHFAHLRFMPLLEGNFAHHKSLHLPFDEYSSFLRVAQALGPRFAVPGSAAFRYSDEYGFLNQYSFPATQTAFLNDLHEFCPEIQSSIFLSGDVAEISPGHTRIQTQASPFVRVARDDGHLVEFKPVMEVPSIRTRTQDPAEQKREGEEVREFIENRFVDRLKSCETFEVWRHWKVGYQLEVFGKNSEPDIWSIDFSLPELQIQPGRPGRMNIYEGISCSELFNLIHNRTNWDYVGASAQYRTFDNIYRVSPGNFEYFPSEKKFPHPLTEIFPSSREMDREKFMKDVRRWKDHA